MIQFSNSIGKLTGESTLLYQDIARRVEKERGIKTINFGIGQPDVITFKEIRDKAKEALDQGFTSYTPAKGIDELRQKIAEYLSIEYKGSDVKKEEVIVTPGAKTALFLSFLLYINPGDEVLLFDPSFYSYAEVVKLLGGNPVYLNVNFDEKSGFSIDLEDLKEKINSKTKMIVLNSPHNPTGMVFSPSEIQGIQEISKERGILLLSDEIYDHFIYEGKMRSVLEDPEWRENTIYLNGFSKTFSMTGWRLGYIVAKKEIIDKMGILASNIYTCATSFAQKGAIESFNTFNHVEEMISLFRRRRDVMFEELSKIDGIKVYKSSGAFYIFPDVGGILERTKLSVKELSIKLIEEAGVITIPGEVFPLELGKRFIRFSFAIDEEKIKEGIRRIKETLDKS
ncbi:MULTISPECIES: pyridoxal phosphate-dependent aminotransferase [Acidianus]|uniref:Aminotransferase n=1 Tax=Candidatus Acidianus copahuensis TaxID=1160895 RepID=A0A031LPE8_9CREN|nr:MULTISPECIES: pyridoxal phosphate-dependent aminotransferase [Acidianus]EZQ06846.1 aspartate aminotransferase [Candidatus Acidianus copahuensis]NON63641.1 pyridoxal phosphate-dependent aminotransferase [Acidianus sp. RZ1]